MKINGGRELPLRLTSDTRHVMPALDDLPAAGNDKHPREAVRE